MMSIEYRGSTFTTTGWPRLQRLDGLLGWDSTVDAEPLAGADGGVPLTGWATPKEFQVVLLVRPTTPEDLAEQQRSIRRAFVRSDREDLLLVHFPGHPDLAVWCRPQLVEAEMAMWPSTSVVRMIASDPVLYGAELHSTPVPVFVGSGGLHYPVDYPKDYGAAGEGLSVHVPNDGDWPTWPRITITGPTTGTVQPLALENTTDGTSITFTAGGGLTIPAGSTLIVDTHPARRVVRFSDGANRWQVVAGTEWWPINPGGADLRFRATGNIDGVVTTVETRDAWL